MNDEKNKEVANISKNSSLTKIDNFSSYEDIYKLGEHLIKSKSLLPPHIKNAEDFCLVSLTAIQLGVNPLLNLKNIIPVNGVVTIMGALRNGLLAKAGADYEIIQDCVPLYKYRDANNMLYDYDYVMKERNNIFQIINPKTDKSEYDLKKIQVLPYPVMITFKDNSSIQDEITTVKGTREILINGKSKTLTSTRSFTLSEAIQAELFSKDNWRKYKKDMMLARTKRRVSDDIGADILAGLPDTVEILDDKNIKYNRTEEGTIEILETKTNSIIETPTIIESEKKE